MMQHKVQRMQIGELVSLHLAAADSGKVLLHALGRNFADKSRIILRLQGNEPDVGIISLVARSRMRNLPQLYLHTVLSCDSVEQLSLHPLSLTGWSRHLCLRYTSSISGF